MRHDRRRIARQARRGLSLPPETPLCTLPSTFESAYPRCSVTSFKDCFLGANVTVFSLTLTAPSSGQALVIGADRRAGNDRKKR
jgi:hypothetical protein